MKTYKLIVKFAINVDGKKRKLGETFEADPKEKEIKRLVLHKYIEEIK